MLRHILAVLDPSGHEDRVLPILAHAEARTHLRTRLIACWYDALHLWGWSRGAAHGQRITRLTCMSILTGVPWAEGGGPTFRKRDAKTYSEYFDDERRKIKDACGEWLKRKEEHATSEARARSEAQRLASSELEAKQAALLSSSRPDKLLQLIEHARAMRRSPLDDRPMPAKGRKSKPRSARET